MNNPLENPKGGTMYVMDRDYGKKLKKLGGDELVAELDTVIAQIKGADGDQRTRDRGSYLVLENVDRVESAEKRDAFLAQMLEANKTPGRGVREALLRRGFARIPKGIRGALTRGMRAAEIKSVVASTPEGERAEIVAECLEDLVAREQLFEAVYLAEAYAKDQLSDICVKAVAHAIEFPRRPAEDYVQKSRGEQSGTLLYALTKAALKAQLPEPFRAIRASPELKHGENLWPSWMFRAAVLIGDEAWQEKMLPGAIKAIGDDPDAHPDAAMRLLGFIKQEKYRKLSWDLFTAIGEQINGRGHAEFLAAAAHVAMEFARGDWMGRVYDKAMSEIKRGTYAAEAYEALEVLATTDTRAANYIAANPKPARKLVMR